MNIRTWRPVLSEVLKYAQGLEGEDIIRAEFKKRKIPHFQVDLIFRDADKYCLAEIKHQEPFEPPPFKGHGLPLWQIEARLRFTMETSLESWLFVVDAIDNRIYYQNLEVLAGGQYFDTGGGNPRRVFPIESFREFTGVLIHV